MALYENILDTIGTTPIVRLHALSPAGVNVYVKLESFNPMGSVKDRMAREVIEQAERSGELRPGQTVVEATSGNTGIGLAMVCAHKGYPLVIVMAENFSVERRKLMRFLGARVVLTPAADKGTGMMAKARELAEQHGYFLCNQFQNEANAEVHYRTTAQEILDDFQGRGLDYWVTGFGTGGTLKGVASRLKQDSAATRVIVAEPDNSPVLASGIAQPRDKSGAPAASHPKFRPHAMQGWAPDFVSQLTEQAVAAQLIDQLVPVNGDHAMTLARQLATREGIFCGISSGATLAAAMEIAQCAEPGTNILCMLPDTGERYLSTPLFADIQEEMNEEEVAISESTPLCQFVQGQNQVIPLDRQAPDDNTAHAFVSNTVQEHQVVMFALEWCEFCWSARHLLSALGVEFESVDLDCVAMQREDLGNRIRKVLTAELGIPTIPQIYINGEHIGGATDLFECYNNGELVRRLAAAGIEFDSAAKPDVNKLMPQWLQPRRA